MGNCPDEFLDLTESDIKATLGDDIQSILFNGFRQSVFDENLFGNISIDFATMVVQFSSLFFFRMGEIKINGPSPSYEDSTVERKVIPLWKKGTKVFELIAPNCSAAYTMQTMWIGGRDGEWGSRNVTDLDTIELDLPEGWTYQSRILSQDRVVPLVNGTATVLTDSAGNAYSKLLDFDPSICPDYIAPTSTPTLVPVLTSFPTAAPLMVPVDLESTPLRSKKGKKQEKGKMNDSYFGKKRKTH